MSVAESNTGWTPSWWVSFALGVLVTLLVQRWFGDALALVVADYRCGKAARLHAPMRNTDNVAATSTNSTTSEPTASTSLAIATAGDNKSIGSRDRGTDRDSGLSQSRALNSSSIATAASSGGATPTGTADVPSITTNAPGVTVRPFGHPNTAVANTGTANATATAASAVAAGSVTEAKVSAAEIDVTVFDHVIEKAVCVIRIDPDALLSEARKLIDATGKAPKKVWTWKRSKGGDYASVVWATDQDGGYLMIG